MATSEVTAASRIANAIRQAHADPLGENYHTGLAAQFMVAFATRDGIPPLDELQRIRRAADDALSEMPGLDRQRLLDLATAKARSALGA